MKRYKLTASNIMHDYHCTLYTGCWFLPPRVAAMTLGKRLILTRVDHPSSIVLAHELIHVEQYRRIRWFMLKYVWIWVWHGSHTFNHYEREAYARQQDFAEHTDIQVTPYGQKQ